MHKKRVKIIVSGLVQGVGFRYYTREKAIRLGLLGYVKNLDNDIVEIVAEGKEDKLNEFILWCRKGPDSAEVSDIKITKNENKDIYNEFQIR